MRRTQLRPVRIFPVFVASLFALCAVPGAARAQSGGPPDSQKTTYSFSAALIYEFETQIKEGGTFSVTRSFFSAEVSVPADKKLRVGFNLAYDHEDYDFSGLTGFPAGDPWNRVQRIVLSASLRYSFKKDWRLLVVPSFGFSGEPGADGNQAIVYGGIISASQKINRDLTLGLGAGVFQQIEGVRAFPYAVIRWQITDKLLLANPFRPGPAGPAGLELAYTLDDDWELAGGGTYRSYRFRLSRTGPVPDGIGEAKFALFFLRLSRKLGPRFSADLYAGLQLGGKLRLENSSGGELHSAPYDPSPVAALVVTGDF